MSRICFNATAPTEICTLPLLNAFFFNDTATTEIYTLSLHDALPIWRLFCATNGRLNDALAYCPGATHPPRSEEHTSELQSPGDLVCRRLLEKTQKSTTLGSAPQPMNVRAHGVLTRSEY